MLLASGVFFSCSDKDDVAGDINRMQMTMFRNNENTGAGETDPYRSQCININTVQLRWYTIANAYGYHIKWADQNLVANGQEAWEQTEADGLLMGDTVILGENSDFLQLEHLAYQKDIRFAIQVLAQPGSGKQDSKWYGYGNGREWAEWFGISTGQRYEVPRIIKKSDVDFHSFRVRLNRSIVDYDADQIASFNQHGFTNDGTNFRVDWLRVEPSMSSPHAAVPQEFRHYVLTDEDWERGYVDVTGLDMNSVYNIDVIRDDIPWAVDQTYNSLSARTKGVAGDPIYVKHEVSDTTIIDANGNTVYSPEIFKKYNAMRIDAVIDSFMVDNSLAENQVFYLEGGKAYVCTTNLNLYKGFKLATDPKDVEAGKKAILYLGGLSRPAGKCASTNFMFGRQPNAGENSTIPIDIDVIEFEDLIVDCPMAVSYGEKQVNTEVAEITGNYFANMYSNGMGINVSMLHLKGCEFHGLIRGFIRTQGSNEKIFHNILIEDCEMFDLGHYDNKGGGYNWIHGQGNQTSSNVFENVVFRNNTFYNSPKGSLITNGNESLTFDSDIRYNLTVENNTFINFQSGSGASALMGCRYVPGGSKFTFHNNLFMLVRRETDINRPLNFCGSDLRGAQGGDGSNLIQVDISNNYSTNDNITSGTGQVFTKEPFNSKKYGFLSYAELSDAQIENLKVIVDDISAAELMAQPFPPYDFNESTQYKAYSCTCIDGSKPGEGMVNLFYNNTDKVRSSKIFQLGIGSSKWRLGIGRK